MSIIIILQNTTIKKKKLILYIYEKKDMKSSTVCVCVVILLLILYCQLYGENNENFQSMQLRVGMKDIRNSFTAKQKMNDYVQKQWQRINSEDRINTNAPLDKYNLDIPNQPKYSEDKWSGLNEMNDLQAVQPKSQFELQPITQENFRSDLKTKLENCRFSRFDTGNAYRDPNEVCSLYANVGDKNSASYASLDREEQGKINRISFDDWYKNELDVLTNRGGNNTN